MDYKLPVLDHGFVQLLNLSGPTRRIFGTFDADDIDPAQSARMSFNARGDRPKEDDYKLNEYLIKNRHNTPIEMIETWWMMKMPIFVARQFVRHRTATINEVSARYVTLPAEWYIPGTVGGKAPNKKQGQGDNLDSATQFLFQGALDVSCRENYTQYLFWINKGVAAEHARLFLHVNHYTHWLWKMDFSNMLNFLRLRDHNHAQIESQLYARAADKLIREHLPQLMSLYDKHIKML